jgi:hypothetical protein
MMKKTSARPKVVRAKANRSIEDILVKEDSPIMQFFRDQLANSKQPLMELDELINLLDEDMGDRTLTAELYKMQHEESL